jgi:hypothetical protein
MRRYALKFGESRISNPPDAAKGNELAGVVVCNLALAWTTREGELPVGRDEDVLVGQGSEDLRHGCLARGKA